MDALLVIDMQRAMLGGAPKLALPDVIQRINQLAAMIRRHSGLVVWIQHDGPPGDSFAPDAPGWHLLPDLDRREGDALVRKRLNDAYAGTDLAAILAQASVGRVLVTGWATDFCVDAAVRSSVSQGFDVVAVSDAHTVADRPKLSAAAVIDYHNWLWADLIPSRTIRVASTAELLAEAG